MVAEVYTQSSGRIPLVAGVLLAVLMVAGGAGRLAGLTTVRAGDMEITSKLMTFQNGVYVARGGLKAVQKTTTVTADRGVYDRNLEIVKAFDQVEVKQPDSTLTCDYLEAYVKEDRMLAQGNPRLERIVLREGRDEETGEIRSRKTRVILTCNEVEGFNKENRYLAKGNVKVIEVSYREGETEEEAKKNEKDPLSDLTCETLEIFSSEDKAIARNDVVIVTKTLRATGDKAIYLDRENRLIIVGHAHAWQTSKEAPNAQEQVSEVYARKIIYYPNEDRTIAVGEVHATVFPKGQRGREDPADRKKRKKKTGKSDEDGTGSPGGRTPAGPRAPGDRDDGGESSPSSLAASGEAEEERESPASRAAAEDDDTWERGRAAESSAARAGPDDEEVTNGSDPDEPPPSLPPGEYTPVGGGASRRVPAPAVRPATRRQP